MTIKYSTICVCITLNLFSYLVFTFFLGFPGGSDAEESACSTGDLGLIPGLGRLPGEGNGNPLQYSCLENPMDGGAWCRLLCFNAILPNHSTLSLSHRVQKTVLYIYFSFAVLYRIRQRHPTPVLLSGKSHGRKSLVGCSPWGH